VRVSSLADGAIRNLDPSTLVGLDLLLDANATGDRGILLLLFWKIWATLISLSGMGLERYSFSILEREIRVLSYGFFRV
jgi:hypothetical protein